MTFVVPPLLGDQPPGFSPTGFLNSLVRAIRECEEDVAVPAFGVIAGVEAGALTQLAAKSLLSRPIEEYYADGKVCFIQEDGPPRGLRRRPLPGGIVRNPAVLSGVENRPLSALSRERVLRFAKAKRQLLVIQTHGRSYCVGRGLLCGARRIAARPEEPIKKCVSNFDCAGPDFLQLDPRRLNARIVVIAACDVITFHADHWRWGNAAVGFLAAAGHPSALLVSDGMVGANSFELLAALVGCTTMGEWSCQLSAMVRGPNPAWSFILIGDPDLAIAIDPLPWAADAKVRRIRTANTGACRSWRVTLPKGNLSLARAQLGQGALDRGEVLYIWPDTGNCDVVSSLLVSRSDWQNVWIAVRSAHGRRIFIRAESRQPIECSPRALEAVRNALSSSPDYRVPALREGWRWVKTAGEHLIDLRLGQQARGRTIREDPYRVTKAHADAEALWDVSQAACLSVIANDDMPLAILPHAYLPAVLWPIEVEEVRTEPKPCPLCESTTLLARDYRSGSRGWRSCYNCPQCGFIIEDKPRDFPSVLSAMDAPQIVAPGQKLEVGIWVRNPYGDRDLGGALHLSPNLTGHRLLPDRPVHRFRLAPHAKQKSWCGCCQPASA